MDWFTRITGFAERDYETTRERLSVVEGRLRSTQSSRACSVGRLETPSLDELRLRTATLPASCGPLRVSLCQGDVRAMHAEAANGMSIFQAASQFNLLEMTDYTVTPEDGVTRYAMDRTQGPACAIAAGAATIYRNYFVSVGGEQGQTSMRQIDCLKDLGEALAERGPGIDLWAMRNGYALCTPGGLRTIDSLLAGLDEAELDQLRGKLRIGLHWDVEVTDGPAPGPVVSQVFCSALPVAYSRHSDDSSWARFATLVLEAAYEATMHAARLNLVRTGCPRVFLTQLGGGAFGNDEQWIDAAMSRALDQSRRSGLDVRLVSYGQPPGWLSRLVARFTDSSSATA
jgi:hypothetical protein